MLLDNLKPKDVFHFFEVLSAIPRPSKKEEKVSNFLLNFAKERNLEVFQDAEWNIIIRKPATKGYEKAPMLILQGHMDMVPEKNKGVAHDFDKDGIKLRIDGDFIKATETTLGADNGIAVAMSLAILDAKDIEHPALEVLITSDEETGMTGAKTLKAEALKGRVMINIDTEEQACIYVSCAGGSRMMLDIPVKLVKSEGKAYHVAITGLDGGHSGIQINEQKGQANKLLGRFLYACYEEQPFHLASIKGGFKENAIPREAESVIVLSDGKVATIEKLLAEYNKIYKEEYRVSDKNVRLEFKETSLPAEMMDSSSTHKVLATLVAFPHGVQSNSLDIPNLVQTSLNPGVLLTEKNVVSIRGTVRSSVQTEKDALIQQLEALAFIAGAKFTEYDKYPSWEYQANSRVRDIASKAHESLFSKKPEIKAIHAGLECGIIGEKFSEPLDIISIGPDIFNPHTPEEKLSIKSTEYTYKWLVGILKDMKNY